MAAFLKAMLPEMLPNDCTFDINPYDGKDGLLSELEAHLKGYASWLPDDYRIVIIVDQDRDDCKQLKSQLEDICQSAGLQSRRAKGGPDWQVVTRIAMEELEAWYFGDWQAVKAAYPKVSPNIPQKAPYRHPDAIKGGTWEAFERVLKKKRYFKQGLPKVQVAQDIGQNIDPARNQSRSFQVFRDAILEAIA